MISGGAIVCFTCSSGSDRAGETSSAARAVAATNPQAARAVMTNRSCVELFMTILFSFLADVEVDDEGADSPQGRAAGMAPQSSCAGISPSVWDEAGGICRERKSRVNGAGV